jgi:hypothetical protein
VCLVLHRAHAHGHFTTADVTDAVPHKLGHLVSHLAAIPPDIT